jgi:hypothetical protein
LGMEAALWAWSCHRWFVVDMSLIEATLSYLTSHITPPNSFHFSIITVTDLIVDEA